MSPSTFLYLVKKLVGFWSRAIALSDFKNFWFFLRLEPNNNSLRLEIMVGFWSRANKNNVPKHFSLSRQKIIEIMVGFWSRAIALSDFKNFWFVELYGSSRTTMSPSTFLYLVKKLSKLWSDFGRGRALSDFKNF